MSDRIKKIKIKQNDGTYSDYIPIGADAKNIDTIRGENLQNTLDKISRYYQFFHRCLYKSIYGNF